MAHTEGVPPDLSLADAVTIGDVRAAAARLAGVARRTPVMTSRSLDGAVGASVFVKCENLQRVGAFKFRGAYNALSRLDPDARRRGVLTYSSGNHAQAVALAASLLGIPAVIVMPDNAPRVKLAATRAYLAGAPAGSEVVLYDPAATVREELGGGLAAARGLEVVPPYDHPAVIAGQGTAALELFEEVGELDALFVCCGGGGLLSGCAVAAKAVCPACRVIGVEPELADDATRSFRDGVLRTARNPPTIADGARTPYLGRYTFAIVRTLVDGMMTVSEREIVGAMGLLMERLRLVVEPTGALATAGAIRAAREGSLRASRVGVVISGGNVDLAELSGLLRGA
ncbi:MAG: threo-3-hydroxy-L-aspartate ammonia-lyase [Phycisphaerales bacterium]|nr:threo-3-hydroxy-L-aspartate ammonia-lyase [Phycisphaerales bacterium]